jgi:hypothetical protein
LTKEKEKEICPKIKHRLGGGKKYAKFAIKKNAELSPTWQQPSN